MKKMISLGVALASAFAATAASTAAVAADDNKHFGYHGRGYRPVYVAPAPVVRPHYGYGYGHGHGHNYRPGYWRNGRWIAPVVIGAAVGGIAIAATAPHYYAPPVTTYVAPVAVSGFAAADYNGDGYVSYDEAARYPHWQRNFGFIDRNRDGYLTPDEVSGWRYY